MTDHLEPNGEPAPASLTRRGFTALGAGTLLAMAAASLARPAQALGANGNAILLGNTANSGSRATSISTTGGTGLDVRGSAGTGVVGSITGTASTSAGVSGKSYNGGNFGVFSNGKLGVTGPVELTQLTITGFTVPASGRLQLFTRLNGAKKIEVCLRKSSGSVVVIATQP